MWTLEKCDARSLPIPDESIQCVVTSPPYWGLRDYGADGQLGLEPTPAEYISNMIEVFREVKRVLRDGGTLWINMGDSYATGTTSDRTPTQRGKHGYWENPAVNKRINRKEFGLKPKDLIGIPWMLAFALRADGWYLRSDIIWGKPNPMPESVTDRPTKAHEYIFLLSKSPRYYYDADAIREPYVSTGKHRATATWVQGWAAGDVPHTATAHAVPRSHNGSKFTTGKKAVTHANVGNGERFDHPSGKNKRSIWWVAPQLYKGAHFATFPEDIPRLCILAGSRPDDFILDPFCGSGTTGKVAVELGRHFIGTDIAYQDLAEARIRSTGIDP